MPILTLENISEDDVVEVLNIFSKEVVNRSIAELKRDVLKKPAHAILDMADVIKIMNEYDIKYELKIEYKKIGSKEGESKKQDFEIPSGVVGLKKSVVEKSMEAQKKEIDNPEIKEIVDNIKPITEEEKVVNTPSSLPSLPDFLA